MLLKEAELTRNKEELTRKESELLRAEETIRREQQQIQEMRQRVSLVCVCVGVGKEVKVRKKSVRDGRSEQGPGGDSSALSKHRANSRTLRLLAWGYRAWSLVIVNCNLFYR